MPVCTPNSHGVAKNNKEAFKWAKKSALQGHAKAQLIIGVMYRKGQGVAKNYQEALKWFKKAAIRGDANAQVLVGSMYYFGEGVARNYIKSYKWYSLWASKGDSRAAKILSILEKKMTAAQVAKAQEAAANFKSEKSRE